MFRSCTPSLRMRSTTLINPDKIFTTIPPPPPWPATTLLPPSPTWRASSSLQWKERGLGDKTLTRILSNLQCTLRSVHKRKIFWPVESSSSKYVCISYGDELVNEIRYSIVSPKPIFDDTATARTRHFQPITLPTMSKDAHEVHTS